MAMRRLTEGQKLQRRVQAAKITLDDGTTERVRNPSRVDLRDPAPRTMGLRLRNLLVSAPYNIVEDGVLWYPKVHDAVRNSEFGVHQGSGIMAAVSPQMDFENSNVHALTEINHLTTEHWNIIRNSLRAQQSGQSEGRMPEAKAVLREVAPSLSRANDSDLMKAHQILNGADYRDVLTAPKTRSFAHNIEFPGNDDGMVTVDGRHDDILTDTMRPWKQDRGISSSRVGTTDLWPNGVPNSRYQRRVDITSEVSRMLGYHPHEGQAIGWLLGQYLERRGDMSRRSGDMRIGQSYQVRRQHFLGDVPDHP